MSAEKCGSPMIAVQVPSESATEVQEPVLPEAFLSGKAFRVLQRIRHKNPSFTPLQESDIWAKARAMGLTEEE